MEDFDGSERLARHDLEIAPPLEFTHGFIEQSKLEADPSSVQTRCLDKVPAVCNGREAPYRDGTTTSGKLG